MKQLPYSGSLYWKTVLKRDGIQPWFDLKETLESMNKDYLLHQPLGRSDPVSDARSTPQPLREFHFIGAAFWHSVKEVLPLLGSLTSLRLDRFAMEPLHMDVVFRSCPQLKKLHLENATLMILPQSSSRLSSLDLTFGARGLLVPSPDDKTFQLKVLTLKGCRVASSTLVDILSVCPRLVEMELTAVSLIKNIDDMEACRHITEAEFLSFVGLACPGLRRCHYSNNHKAMEADSVKALFQDNPRVTEWIFLRNDLNVEQLMARNIITYLEIKDDPYPRSRPKAGLDLMSSKLHRFLCHAPLLRELILSGVHCATDRLDPFPTSLKAEPHRMSRVKDSLSPNRFRLWACTGLQTLSLYFTQSYNIDVPRKLTGRDVRVVFGYLSRVCPNLRHVNIGLDSAPMDLQSGLCLVSRLKYLKTLTIQMPEKASIWSRGPDLSWMEPPSFLGLSAVFQQREMNKWGLLLREEQSLIQKREIYLERTREVDRERRNGKVGSVGMKGSPPGGIEFADSLALLGTLTDVRNCMRAIMENKHDGTVGANWHRSRPPRVAITGC
ncbi:hypothetical protein MVEG_01428 [Podila verticillata NRRL 6337]|nr:hypothetical protein MVEG_01428 [Podila verticillata NRRL 6337]